MTATQSRLIDWPIAQAPRLLVAAAILYFLGNLAVTLMSYGSYFGAPNGSVNLAGPLWAIVSAIFYPCSVLIGMAALIDRLDRILRSAN